MRPIALAMLCFVTLLIFSGCSKTPEEPPPQIHAATNDATTSLTLQTVTLDIEGIT